jgi:homoserine dehydrogenase
MALQKEMAMSKQTSKKVTIGLLGLGTVGTGVYEIIRKQARVIEKKTGVRLIIRRICDKYLSKKRIAQLPRGLYTADADTLLNDPTINILIELIGGIHPAKEIILKALKRGKHVVTANKALLAEAGDSVFDAAVKCHRDIGFEASVCGAIPIIKSVKESLAANNISHFLGIVNGTCNYILTQMSQEGMDFHEALKRAQAKGYAESNPRLDVEGIDSAHKLAVLARLAFRSKISFDAISVQGIQGLSSKDINYAKELGYTIKLLAIGKKFKKGLELRVHPTMLPNNHPLSSIRGVYNAIFLHADQAGDLLFYGRGAGREPAASAVMSDVIDIAKKICEGRGWEPLSEAQLESLPVLPVAEIISRYYLRFQVVDKPGVLGRIARTLGSNHISILSVQQKESHNQKSVPVVILTYEASEKNLQTALKKIDAMKDISEKTVFIRVES